MVGVAVVVLVAWYGISGGPMGRGNPATPSDNSSENLIDLNAKLLFSPVVPASAAPTPPEQVFFSGEEGVRLNSFSIVADRGAFTPSTIVVEGGQNVQVNFTAVDRDYDIGVAAPIGAYVVAKAGETQVFGFSMDQEGTYAFRCQQFCPEGRAIEGSIIILKKN